MTILVTGCAGFIGFHTVIDLLKYSKVVGIDNFNDYYDVKLKKSRVEQINKNKNKKNFIFLKLDLTNKKSLTNVFKKYKIKKIIHLAAKAGVKHSLKKPKIIWIIIF